MLFCEEFWVCNLFKLFKKKGISRALVGKAYDKKRIYMKNAISRKTKTLSFNENISSCLCLTPDSLCQQEIDSNYLKVWATKWKHFHWKILTPYFQLK